MDSFEHHRRYLTRLCYRLLGSVADAEDVVQDGYLRWRTAGAPELENPRAWWTKTCTRLALDRLRSARQQRERYVGEWLPEPLPADADEDRRVVDESVSVALLRTIERLRPSERAAFLLHDVFGYEFVEVAEILGLEAAHCRQLAVRARRHLEGGRVRERADPQAVARVSDAFFGAIRSGDLDGIRSVLAEDVVLYADGGGRVAAVRAPLEGVDAVAVFFHRIFERGAASVDVRSAWFNGAPGVLVCERDRPVSAFAFEIRGQRISGIFVQRNPDKLRALSRGQ